MRLFVTGGTGFLGSCFLKRAIEAGHECHALIRPCSSAPRVAQVNWVESGLGTLPTEQLEGFDALVHLASAGVSPQPVTWEMAMDVNVAQSVSMVAKAAAAGVRRILLCGSCFEYGRSGERYERIPPTAPLEPVGPYAASKAAFSVAAASFATTTTAEIVLLRPFHFFGEGQHPSNFWPSLKRAAFAGMDFPMTGGAQVRDFQSVEDTADGFLDTLARWPGKAGQFTALNLGSGQEVTLRQFAESWWEFWKAPGRLLPGAVPYRQGEVMRFVPDLTR